MPLVQLSAVQPYSTLLMKLSFRYVSLVLAVLAVAAGLPSRVAAQTSTSFAVSKLVLINTSTQQALRTLTTGSTINFATDGSALNVRADVTGTVGSIAFTLVGKLIQTENYAPFALDGGVNFGDVVRLLVIDAIGTALHLLAWIGGAVHFFATSGAGPFASSSGWLRSRDIR